MTATLSAAKQLQNIHSRRMILSWQTPVPTKAVIFKTSCLRWRCTDTLSQQLYQLIYQSSPLAKFKSPTQTQERLSQSYKLVSQECWTGLCQVASHGSEFTWSMVWSIISSSAKKLTSSSTCTSMPSVSSPYGTKTLLSLRNNSTYKE